MRYKPADGVVLFPMCGACFLFPSRKSGIPVPFISPVPQELVPVLQGEAPDRLTAELSDRLQRWVRTGFVEEY